MHAHPQAAVQRSGGVFVDAAPLLADLRRVVMIFGPRRDRRAFQERHRFIEHGVVCRRPQIVQQRMRQPQQVVAEVRAHARPTRFVPPMLNVTFDKLA